MSEELLDWSKSSKNTQEATALQSPDFNPFSPIDQNNTFANSVDPDEMFHIESLHQDLRCLPFCFDFGLRPLFGTMALTRFKDRRFYFRHSGVNGLKINSLIVRKDRGTSLLDG